MALKCSLAPQWTTARASTPHEPKLLYEFLPDFGEQWNDASHDCDLQLAPEQSLIEGVTSDNMNR